jgi:Fur family transcriptional regulator, iron response regulator
MRNHERPPANGRLSRLSLRARPPRLMLQISSRRITKVDQLYNSPAKMALAVSQRHAMSMETKSAPNPDVCYGVLLRKLAAAGVRPTRQRLDLARAIFGAGNRHFTAEMIYHETRSIQFAPTLGTIYNTLNEFSRSGLLREIAIYDAKLWYDTKTGPHYHFYREDTEELSDIPEEFLPEFDIPAPDGMRVAAIDVIVRLKKN